MGKIEDTVREQFHKLVEDHCDLTSRTHPAYHEIMKIYFDGGCRPNPGQMSTAIVLVRDSGKPLVKISKDIGRGTNNIAEWMALVWAADFMRDQGIKTYEIYGDSNLIINQALGKYKTSDQFLGFKTKFLELTQDCTVTLAHVYRANNPAGHALEL